MCIAVDVDDSVDCCCLLSSLSLSLTFVNYINGPLIYESKISTSLQERKLHIQKRFGFAAYWRISACLMALCGLVLGPKRGRFKFGTCTNNTVKDINF